MARAVLPRVKAAPIVLLVVAVAALGLGAWAVGVHNDLVGRAQAVQARWAQVQNVYQRRADLVPNLVEAVAAFARQERAVLAEVTRARAAVTALSVTPGTVDDPGALGRFQEAQIELGSALGRLLVVVEGYPELRSSQHFLTLQSQLAGTENRIAVERRRYNEAVREYNTAIGRFPASLVASLRGFRGKAYFEAAPGSQAAPPVAR